MIFIMYDWYFLVFQEKIAGTFVYDVLYLY